MRKKRNRAEENCFGNYQGRMVASAVAMLNALYA